MNQRRIIIDESAADALPMRITVAAIVIAIIMVLLASGVSNMLTAVNERKAVNEAEKIAMHAEQISLRGEGSRIVLDIDVPTGYRIVLGALAHDKDNWPVNANSYHIQTGRRNIIKETGASFSDEFMAGPAIIPEGSHQIIIESIRDPSYNRLFIAAYIT
ncbi:conserved hypothetical protein [Methanosalsum zhilinae DSM 4017]|uniref:Flagellin n=1 Tax=Methanosalsum zhilinae (strain DSM 4017 / NBRC 107636 / OCM 62 / WeN5) TaxID=679901 RepID=F7XNP9_METZD|nr:hypothetical protein [Methanosalsum zhilinae]AEH61250.1 conserved hypothetical protein [Methanosalsum zhilinae DSM 4017]